MIKLKWYQYPGSNITGFKLYRSILGFTAPIVSLTGKTLQLKINGGATQSHTFNATSIIDQINANFLGIRAAMSLENNANFIFRNDVRVTPIGSIQIVGGTAVPDLGLTVRTITEKSEDQLLATIPPALNPDDAVTYDDPDGSVSDWYAISTVDNFSFESTKSAYKHPITSSGNLCVIEGIVMTLQGTRVSDAIVSAVVQVPPEPQNGEYDPALALMSIKPDPLANITKDIISTMSGVDGRFSLALLQGSIVKFECEAVGLSRMIRIPRTCFAYINDIKVDLDYIYP